MAVIIEVLGWGGKSQRHYRVEGSSITLGRGYQNDVVLSDSHISPNHLRLDALDNGWQLTDLESLNGVEILKNPASQENPLSAGVLADGAEIKVGRTRLRIIADSYQVEPAKALHRLEREVGQLNRFSIWLPLFLLSVTVSIGSLYVNSFVEWQWKNIVSTILASQVAPLILALFWSGLGRLLREESNFLGHYNLILLASLIYTSGAWLTGIIAYNLSAQILISVAVPLFSLLLVAVLLSANFALATHMQARQRWITSIAFVALVMVVSIATRMQQWGEFSPYPVYFSAIELPLFQLGGGASVDAYISGLDDLFVDADQLAAKK